MNNTTFEMINSAVIFYNETYTMYNSNNEFNEILTINKVKLKNDMPLNLKSPIKLNLLNTFGDNVTQEQFVELLMIQKSGADFLNIIYLIKYHNLKLDENGMIIWNELCAYNDFCYEAINNWYIWNTLSKHTMFSKYMNKLLEFKLQTRLEGGMFSTIQNFKQDLCFPNANMIVECNEGHHEKPAQKILDAEKIALNKMNGNCVISLYTNSIVNIVDIKKTIYNNLCDNVDDALTILLETIYFEEAIVDEEDKKIIAMRTITEIRNYFKIKYTPLNHKKNLIKYNKIYRSKYILITIKKVLQKYFIIINETIHAKILNNSYLKCYISALLDILLSACLKDFEFRQDYIQMILVENLIDRIESDIKYIPHIQNVIKIKYPGKYQDIYDTKIKSYKNINYILTEFKNDSEQFTLLFELKKKSIIDPSNTYFITIENLTKLFRILEDNIIDIEDFEILVKTTCNIDTNIQNINILISWNQLLDLIFAYDGKPSLQRVLMVYYRELDLIYEIIIRRLSENSKRIGCTPNDYNNYLGRIYKKITTNVVDKYKNNVKKLTNHINGLNIIVAKFVGTTLAVPGITLVPDIITPPKTVCEEIVGFKYIMVSDIEKITRINRVERLAELNEMFEALTIVVKVQNVHQNFVDHDEVG